MSNMFSQLMVQYTALFSIINPLGGAFVFFAITRALPLPDRERLAGRVGLYTWVTLLAALFGGLYLLVFLRDLVPGTARRGRHHRRAHCLAGSHHLG